MAQLKSSTLIEVIVSLVVITCSIGVGVLILTGVFTSDKHQRLNDGYQLFNWVEEEPLYQHNFSDDEIQTRH